jgi:hypothetical protein
MGGLDREARRIGGAGAGAVVPLRGCLSASALPSHAPRHADDRQRANFSHAEPDVEHLRSSLRPRRSASRGCST